MTAMDGIYGGKRTTLSVGGWTRHEVACTPETIISMLTEVYMSGTFGYHEPPLIRMGKGFHDTLIARMNVSREATNKARTGAYLAEQYIPNTVPDIDQPELEMLVEIQSFMGAKILFDDRFDSWSAQVFMWDRETYELPILFVVGTVKLVDAQ